MFFCLWRLNILIWNLQKKLIFICDTRRHQLTCRVSNPEHTPVSLGLVRHQKLELVLIVGDSYRPLCLPLALHQSTQIGRLAAVGVADHDRLVYGVTVVVVVVFVFVSLFWIISDIEHGFIFKLWKLNKKFKKYVYISLNSLCKFINSMSKRRWITHQH